MQAVTADFVVVVDVLRFTTAVEAATTSGALVHPYRWRDESARELAALVDARLADGRDPTGPSLSPVSLLSLQPGERLVLPSPNGSTCAAIAAEAGATVLAGCLRNYAAIAEWLNVRGGSVAVIACGERWSDGSLRPAIEDYLGAAALVSALQGRRSAEAEVAASCFDATRRRVPELVRESSSGRELLERGWDDDVTYAVEVGASATVPLLVSGAFRSAVDPRP